ncbi:MAG: hypothetical protein R6V85_20415 [Polyangia bacterium]
MLVPSVVLLASWAVPDLWSTGPIFAWELIGRLSPFDAAAAIAPPACGAVLLAISVLPLGDATRAAAAILCGAIALALPLLSGSPNVVVPGYLALVAALLAASGGAWLIGIAKRALIAHALHALLPAALLVAFFARVAIGEDPAGYLAGFKAPVLIWAATAATAWGISRFLPERSR